jgi:imidazolonepropionase-like amidohydrolase
MVTVNPAMALRQQNALGKICRGAHADLLAVPCNAGETVEEIIAFTGDPWVMIAGEVRQGNAIFASHEQN